MSIELVNTSDMPKLAGLFNCFHQNEQVLQQEAQKQNIEISVVEYDNDDEDITSQQETYKNGKRVIKRFGKQTIKDMKHEHEGLKEIYQSDLDKTLLSLKTTQKEISPTAYAALERKRKELEKQIEDIDKDYAQKLEKIELQNVSEKNKSKDNGLEKLDPTINMYVNAIIMHHKNNNSSMVNKFYDMAKTLDSENKAAFPIFDSRLNHKLDDLGLKKEFEDTYEFMPKSKSIKNKI